MEVGMKFGTSTGTDSGVQKVALACTALDWAFVVRLEPLLDVVGVSSMPTCLAPYKPFFDVKNSFFTLKKMIRIPKRNHTHRTPWQWLSTIMAARQYFLLVTQPTNLVSGVPGSIFVFDKRHGFPTVFTTNPASRDYLVLVVGTG
jgi:hypothetical protein